jgi:tRNA (guanine-N7-)-methyltransferase
MPHVRRIVSAQQTIHENLDATVLKHLNNAWQKPMTEHTLEAFKDTETWLRGKTGELILDSCCGYGESTRWLAVQNPKAIIIGIDKSANRLNKKDKEGLPSNCKLVRADVKDFWRLAVEASWQPTKHYLLYPNPYPKPSQLNSRWHGSPAFTSLVNLGGSIEVRTNWDIYIKEFSQALQLSGHDSKFAQYLPSPSITAFERKYHNDGQSLWQLTCNI